ncbi:g5497 [Coccomyxa elongata]
MSRPQPRHLPAPAPTGDPACPSASTTITANATRDPGMLPPQHSNTGQRSLQHLPVTCDWLEQQFASFSAIILSQTKDLVKQDVKHALETAIAALINNRPPPETYDTTIRAVPGEDGDHVRVVLADVLWAVFQAMQCVHTIKGNASLKVIMNTLKIVYLQPWGIKATPEAINTGVALAHIPWVNIEHAVQFTVNGNQKLAVNTPMQPMVKERTLALLEACKNLQVALFGGARIEGNVYRVFIPLREHNREYKIEFHLDTRRLIKNKHYRRGGSAKRTKRCNSDSD